ncbi:hypothetical protein [Variovorax sp. J22R115]|uniref:hypothetical protein n=1 Tax=Variovorax sp. J22R115 TaxID=3053509 RepID=UPI002575BDEE|nr:hypothetical protein [Variovorax sp. J22R115]MDM0052646.1 hypothetical protein [Variovorax sp. J22R115]
MPDDIMDGFLRPFAMLLPDADIYAEIRAPDVRLALVAVFSLVYVATRVKGTSNSPDSMGRVLAFLCATFIAWILTSGNGRYYLAILVIVGPVCVALIWRLPLSAFLKGATLMLALVVQFWLASTAQPLQAWSLTDWNSVSPFHMELPESDRGPATFLTLATPSYSVLAPSFSSDARWVNLSFLKGVEGQNKELLQKLLRQSARIKTIYPNYLGLSSNSGYPSKQVLEDINLQLAEHHLTVMSVEQCRSIIAKSFGPKFAVQIVVPAGTIRGAPGFWLCDTIFDSTIVAPPYPGIWPEAVAISKEIESRCPRFFGPGKGAPTLNDDFVFFDYPASDMRLYVYRSGEVAYKYYNALNPIVLRKAQGGSLSLDCTKIRRTFLGSLFDKK